MNGSTSRVLYCLLFLIPLGGVVVVVAQNDGDIGLNYLARSGLVGIPVLVVATYLMGVLSGWAVAGLIKYLPGRFTGTASDQEVQAQSLGRLRDSLRRVTQDRGFRGANGEVPGPSPACEGPR